LYRLDSLPATAKLPETCAGTRLAYPHILFLKPERHPMTDPNTFDPNNIKLQPLAAPSGLLEQFNLPPRAIAFIRRHQRSLWAAVMAAVAISLSVAGYNAYVDSRERRAVSALDAALIAPQDNKILLEQVVKEFGSTKSALWARVELALLEERAGQTAQAIGRLEEIRTSLAATSPLQPLVIVKLATLYENDNKLETALALYGELSTWPPFAADAYRAQGRVSEQLGKPDQAMAMYDKYLESATGQSLSGQGDPLREMIQARVNQLKKDS
jgi:predicted negative regulator of RcsB-dependent stress response